ncbi:energy transducer TonB [Sphingomonas japonica]|uniref:Protein TonB n=1 Tax=Sphingomonas japonica TaxID=511662 RepID=A0ABX0U1C7_9SPHN|nr:energy transducer TonB [Sphingomonas japonica]NIJ24365.1 protein TonB [Sphingomonas japonica]
MPTYAPSPADRIKSAALAVALTGLAGWALVAGLGIDVQRAVADSLATFTVLPEAVPPPVEQPPPDPVESAEPEGEAAPPNLRSQATPIVAPPPPIPIRLPPPVVTAPVAGTGSDASQGAADIPGPGTGAGGSGDGTGSGGSGDGSGGGGRAEIPPRQIAGAISSREIARALPDQAFRGTVSVWFDVEADGRVSDCGIDRSSGNRAYDALICRLIRQRFRFDPARDAQGRAVPSTIVEDHSWEMDLRLIDRGTRRVF